MEAVLSTTTAASSHRSVDGVSTARQGWSASMCSATARTVASSSRTSSRRFGTRRINGRNVR
jgi:hypothetical protein